MKQVLFACEAQASENGSGEGETVQRMLETVPVTVEGDALRQGR